MAKPLSYGSARAGLLTPQDPCKGPLGYGIVCTANDAEAWFQAGRQWAQFVRGLVANLKSKEPPSTWPPEIKATAEAAQLTADQFNAEPWVAFEGKINEWADAQQYLRDAASLLATRLRDKHGLAIGGIGEVPAPGQLKPEVSKTAIAVGVVGGVAVIALAAYAMTR